MKITWDEIVANCKTLSQQLQGKRIWGVPRGGTIVTGILSYMGCVLSTGGAGPLSGDIIVDDIVDTGTTLGQYTREGFETAVLYVRKGCHLRPDLFVQIINHKEYLQFPWETTRGGILEGKLTHEYKGLVK